MKSKTRNIKLNFKLAFEPSEYHWPKGFVLKREPTTKEAMYILQKLMGFANEDYKEWFDDKEEASDYLQQCQISLTEFLRGDCDYANLCDMTQCYDEDDDGFMMPMAFTIAEYLIKKDII